MIPSSHTNHHSAQTFVGHVQSTFSQELFKVFRREGRHHRFYNPPCADWQECRHIPDAYQVRLQCARVL